MKTCTALAWTALLMLTAAVSLQQRLQAQQQFTAGDTVCFTIAAIDAQGDTIRDWDQKGSDCTIKLHNSTANSDTSNVTWNSDPHARTFAVITKDGMQLAFFHPNIWTLPHSLFIDGKAVIKLVHTKAESGIYFEITTIDSKLHIVSDAFDFVPAEIDNFLVELTSSHADREAVYLKRKYELVVSPRDRFLNYVDKPVMVQFTAHYPDEFEPGADLLEFSGDPIQITGTTAFYASSSIVHGYYDAQWIRVFDSSVPEIDGRTDPFEILDHAPGPFELVEPKDGFYLALVGPQTSMKFSWENSIDPYTNILVSNDEIRVSDMIAYRVFFTDSASTVKKFSLFADDSGHSTSLNTTHAALADGIHSLGYQSIRDIVFFWSVEANDGIYTTKSVPPISHPSDSGYHICFYQIIPGAVSPIPSAATGISLHQNYPNPVRAGAVTNIRFETTGYGPVTMKVYDMLGSEVATLADETLAPGVYNADFSASGLAPGVYHYTLTTGGTMTTKSMAVTK